MSGPVWSFSLETFGKRAPKVFAALCAAVLANAVDEIGARWFPLAQARTPIGGIFSKRRRDRAPGLLQRSWVRYRNRTGFEKIKNVAPHSVIIDRGRKRGVTPVGQQRDRSHRKGKPIKTARMLGSVQAPQGMTRPTWKRINGVERPEISRRAIAKAEASVPSGVVS